MKRSRYREDGPRSDGRSEWDFPAGGSVVARFTEGRLSGPAAGPSRFEVTPSCGNSKLSITLNEWVNNVKIRVFPSAHAANVLGAGFVNPGVGSHLSTRQDPQRSSPVPPRWCRQEAANL